MMPLPELASALFVAICAMAVQMAWCSMMPLPGLQIYLQPPVTLNFDLLIREVDSFMPLHRGSLVQIGIKIS